jgi:casein kinase II subunit beta
MISLEQDLESGDEETSSSNLDDETWVQWFCGLPGNELYCEVDKAFITDNFNLFGIRNHIRSEEYPLAMDIILDRREPVDGLDSAVKMLYGLIHARYILTAAGLDEMKVKFCEGAFGNCPREFCRGQHVLPMGLSDEPLQGPVKLFCSKCQDVYASQRNLHYDVDGAFFTTTFPNLFFMTYNDLVPERPADSYIPRIFGFKIHTSSLTNPRLVAAEVASPVKNGNPDQDDSWGEVNVDAKEKISARETEARAMIAASSASNGNSAEKRKLDSDEKITVFSVSSKLEINASGTNAAADANDANKDDETDHTAKRSKIT